MRRFAVLAVLLWGAGLAGCSPGPESGAADKAGGSSGVVVLRLGDAYTQDAGNLPALNYFAQQVEGLSDGALRIETTYAAAGLDRPDAEQEVARMVREGRLDLGYVGAEGWDELGVDSFAGLFAPLLVDDDALLNALVRGRLASQMLAGLRGAGVVGLAVVPRSLGPPVGFERAFVSPADFAGAHVAVTPSKATDAALRALGARPVHLSAAARAEAIAEGRVDAELPGFDLLPAAVVTGNVALLPRLNTLFINPDSLESLTDDEQLALRRAAARTVVHVIATRPTAQAALRRFCSIGRGASATGGGRAVLASASDLDALLRATRPVYDELRRDPHTRDVIERIVRLKRSLPPGRALRLPPGCSTPMPALAGGGKPRPPSELNGTYRWLLTRDAAYAFGRGADNEETLAELPSVVTFTLRDGRWQLGPGPEADVGTYTATAHRISFVWPAVNSVLTFAYSTDPDGTLHLTPLPSVERGDRFVWSSQPWRRIGPPVREIP